MNLHICSGRTAHDEMRTHRRCVRAAVTRRSTRCSNRCSTRCAISGSISRDLWLDLARPHEADSSHPFPTRRPGDFQHVGQVFFENDQPRMGDINGFMKGREVPAQCRKKPEWRFG